jgi:hypothetical protein
MPTAAEFYKPPGFAPLQSGIDSVINRVGMVADSTVGPVLWELLHMLCINSSRCRTSINSTIRRTSIVPTVVPDLAYLSHNVTLVLACISPDQGHFDILHSNPASFAAWWLVSRICGDNFRILEVSPRTYHFL